MIKSIYISLALFLSTAAEKNKTQATLETLEKLKGKTLKLRNKLKTQAINSRGKIMVREALASFFCPSGVWPGYFLTPLGASGGETASQRLSFFLRFFLEFRVFL